MVDAVVGAVIMVVATTSLLYSIEVVEKAFDQAGQYPLSSRERELLKEGVGLDDDSLIEQFWRINIKEAPREVGLDQ